MSHSDSAAAPAAGGAASLQSGSVDPQSIEGLFLAALQQPPQERDAFLDAACQNDPERRRRITALLRAYEDAGSFLESPAGGPRPASETDEIRLDFLTPTDKPGCLGTIGPYEVINVIGRGGMGIVLRALDPKLNRIVAVKVLAPELAANPNARRRFIREAQAAASISHPHVVTIHAVDDGHSSSIDQSPSSLPFLVMECVVGQSLQQKLDRQGSLRLTEILRIGHQIACGLAAAHKQGLIHRDIKPANILLENGVERVKITDFGLARLVDDVAITRTGEVAGTPQYMSPEQAHGDKVDHRSDLFSFGCVLYAMCTGHSPFRGDSMAHVIKRVTQDEPRPIDEQNPEIPGWLCDIISRLLEKSPDSRFQSTEEVAEFVAERFSRSPLAAATAGGRVETRQKGVIPPAPPDHSWLVKFLAVPTRLGGRVLVVPVIFAVLLLALALASQGRMEMTGANVAEALILLGILATLLGLSLTIRWLIGRQAPAAVEHFDALATNSPGTQPPLSSARAGRLVLLARIILWCSLTMLLIPWVLILTGPVIHDGDIVQFGGQAFTVVLPIGIIGAIAGVMMWIVAFIIDDSPRTAVAIGRPAIMRLEQIELGVLKTVIVVCVLLGVGGLAIKYITLNILTTRSAATRQEMTTHPPSPKPESASASAPAAGSGLGRGTSRPSGQDPELSDSQAASRAGAVSTPLPGIRWTVDRSYNSLDQAGTVQLNIRLLSEDLLIGLRRKSLFDRTTSPEEKVVTKLGDSALRVQPGDYQVVVRDERFGWADSGRQTVIAVKEDGIGTLEVERSLVGLFEDREFAAEQTFHWDGVAYLLKGAEIHAVNLLAQAYTRGAPDVPEELLLGQLRKKAIAGEPFVVNRGGGPLTYKTPERLEQIFKDDSGSLAWGSLVIPGAAPGTYRLQRFPEGVLRFAVPDRMSVRVVFPPGQDDPESHLIKRSIEFRSTLDQTLRLRPGRYVLAVHDADVHWSVETVDKFGNADNLFMATSREEQITIDDQAVVQPAIFRQWSDYALLPKIPENSFAVPSETQTLRYRLRWFGRSARGTNPKQGYGWSSEPACFLTPAAAEFVASLFQGLADGQPDVKYIGDKPIEELFPGLADGDWEGLIIPGETAETWRLNVPEEAQQDTRSIPLPPDQSLGP